MPADAGVPPVHGAQMIEKAISYAKEAPAFSPREPVEFQTMLPQTIARSLHEVGPGGNALDTKEYRASLMTSMYTGTGAILDAVA